MLKKKTILMITLLLLCVSLFAACLQPQAMQPNSAVTSSTQTGIFVENISTSADSSKYITADKAKEIATAHAGFKVSEVEFVKVKRDTDDARVEYEIDFYKDDVKYEYEINATTGKIISYESENKSWPGNVFSKSKTPTYISKDDAIDIAYTHAGINSTNARLEKGKFEHDDGHPCYEIEFWANNMSYEYEIDAETGKIISYEHDDHNGYGHNGYDHNGYGHNGYGHN